MAEAPFCNVTVATPDGQPGSPKGLQHIPSTATIQQLIRIINQNFQTINNFGSRPPPTPEGGGQSGFTTKPGQEEWKELTRKTETVDVPVKDTDGQQIGEAKVKQITGLTMKSKKTGETWVWKR